MPLVDDILFGTLESVQQRLNKGADVEEIDEYGFSPLIEAAIAGKLEVAHLLLQRGAEVDNPDATGRTALHWAVDNHDLPLCQLLLEYKADPNAYTHGGQPLLSYPLLRRQTALKQRLVSHGAQLNFAQDFIQTKLLGHRYELSGQADIVNAKGEFIPVDYEGFFLEFTLDIIRHSLERYRRHFAARALKPYFPYLEHIFRAFQTATALLKYQRYTIDIKRHAAEINPLFQQPLLFLPLAYEGHAIGWIKYRNWIVRCDRGANSQREGSVVIYQLDDPRRWTLDFAKQLLYQPQSEDFITHGIQSFLGLKSIGQLPLQSQLIGNCSWANLEAAIPAMLFLLQLKDRTTRAEIQGYKDAALSIYSAWQQWDKARALEEVLKSFPYASPARKATKATLLGAVLFQTCRYLRAEDLSIAAKLLPVLSLPDYQYILKSYLKVYWQDHKTPQGQNLVQLLDDCGVQLI